MILFWIAMYTILICCLSHLAFDGRKEVAFYETIFAIVVAQALVIALSNV